MADEAPTEGTSSTQAIGESSESTIEINIKTLDSQLYTLRVNKDMPVPMLKEKIVNATGVPVEQQRLIFRGKVLTNDHLLSEYHLEDGHTLHLVARQPVQAQSTIETGPEGTAQNNNSQGNDSTAGAPRNRVGQVSRSVVLGTVNIADQGESMAADISRLIGSVLNSLGVGTLAPTGGASNTSPSTISNQVPLSAGTEGTQSGSGRTQPGSGPPPGFTVLNHPFQPLRQTLQFPPTGALPRHMVIPDSLTTLSEFISHMERALQIGSQSPPHTNARDPLQSETPLNIQGLPTPEILGLVMGRVQRLLSNNASAALSHVAARLEREGASTDPVLRGQIQNEAMHVGVAMQDLGAMLLELGRTIMMLRMGRSPAESSVNTGPAVYISPTGPNPIMVQPFPLQTASLFGVSSPPLVGVSGPFTSVDPSRNINIHIHAGSSVAPGVSSVGARESSGQPDRGERPNVEQASTNGNGSGDSMQGLPTRTVVASIPARPTAEAVSHVLSVIYPVHVRSQQSFPIHSASAQGPHPVMSSGTQPNIPILVPQPSSESGTIPRLVAQINAHIASTLAGNAPGQISPSPSMQSTYAQAYRPSMSNEAQPNMAISLPQTPSETNTTPVTQRDAQLTSAISGNAPGQSPSPSLQCTDPSSTREGPQLISSGSMGGDDANGQAGNTAVSEDSGRSDSVKLHIPDNSMPGSEGKQFQPEGLHFPNNVDLRGSLNTEESLTSTSREGPTDYQPSDTVSNKLVIETSEKNSDSIASVHALQSSQGGEGGRPAPLGLGLGGLQSKRRGKLTKSIQNDEVSHHTPSTHQNQQSIARGQQFLHSLASQTSDVSSVNANDSSIPLSSVVGRIMDGMPLGAHGGGGQVDAANLMSHVLQSPAFNNILTGVGAQTGVGSPSDLRSMLQQLTQSPGVRNMLNEMVQQVEGQNQDLEGMLSGLGRGQGGLDFSRMIQQMVPVVSQVLGRGSTSVAPINGVQSEHQPQCNDGRTGGDVMLHERNSQIDLHQAVERIEQHNAPGDVFRAVLESAGRLHGEGDNYEDLLEELGDNVELTNEFMRMLCRDIRRRLQTGSTSEDMF